MNADDVARYQKDALTGHRPTWKMGVNSGGQGQAADERRIRRAADPFQHVRRAQRPRPLAARRAASRGRDAQGDERRAQGAAGDGARRRVPSRRSRRKFKALVKQHHPDANGGDRSTEDRLIEIIKAYNYLKTVVKEA